MVKILGKTDTWKAVITLARWSMFYAESVAFELAGDLMRVERLASGKFRVIAMKDLVIVVEGLWTDSYTGADRIMFVRADRAKEAVGTVWLASPQHWPELRNALLVANVSPVRAIDGFDQVPIYNDEIAILESAHGTHGWIIKREDIRRYLWQKTPKNDIRVLGRFKIWHEIHIGKDGEFFPRVRIEGWNEPQNFEAATVWNIYEFTILFDKKSRIVQQISLTNAYVENLSVGRSPLRSIAIGRKLPRCLAWK